MLLRSIDLITLARPKALLWQARVVLEKHGDHDDDEIGATTSAGGGALIVSGLNLLVNRFGTSNGNCPSNYPFLIRPGHPNSKWVSHLVWLKSFYTQAL